MAIPLLVLLFLSACHVQASFRVGSPSEQPVRFPFHPLPDLRKLPPGASATRVLSLPVPTALAFAPDGRVFIAEKGGFEGDQEAHVWTFNGASLQRWLTLTVSTEGERGLVGLALDPYFERDGFVYLVYTSARPQPEWRLVRYRDESGRGVEPTVLMRAAFDPSCSFHFSGHIAFGPDGRLYVAIGDLCLGNPAQYLEHPAGKMHRLNPDGTIPPDNPFYDGSGPNLDSVFALGFRNTFAFTFDPLSGQILGAENGPQCNDELNRIRPGGNYGWPWDFNHQTCEYADLPQFEKPLYVWKTPIAPAGIAVYSGPMFPEWNGAVLICAWNTGQLHLLTLDDSRQRVTGVFAYSIPGASCRIGPWVAPDGAVWFADADGLYRLYRPWRNLSFLLPLPR